MLQLLLVVNIAFDMGSIWCAHCQEKVPDYQIFLQGVTNTSEPCSMITYFPEDPFNTDVLLFHQIVYLQIYISTIQVLSFGAFFNFVIIEGRKWQVGVTQPADLPFPQIEICPQSVQCTMYYVLCTMYYVLCTMSYVQCIMYNVQCTIYNLQCTMYYLSTVCIMYLQILHNTMWKTFLFQGQGIQIIVTPLEHLLLVKI